METHENKQLEVLQTLIMALGSGLAVWGAVNLLNGTPQDSSGVCEQAKKQIAAGGELVNLACRITPQGIIGFPA